MPHTQTVKNMLLDVEPEGLTAYHLDDEASNEIVGIGVLKSRSHRLREAKPAQLANTLLYRVTAAPGQQLAASISANSARMGEEVTKSDSC